MLACTQTHTHTHAHILPLKILWRLYITDIHVTLTIPCISPLNLPLNPRHSTPPPAADAHCQPNHWIAYFTSTENRHALPIFTSLLNITCAYDPIGYGLPYNHLMFADSREPLVEVALQVLCVSLDNNPPSNVSVDGTTGGGATAMESASEVGPLSKCDY